MADAVFESPSQKAAAACRVAVGVAYGTLTRRSISFALALTAAESDDQAVDSLLKAYHAAGDVFLASSLLEAIGLLAERSPLARSELLSVLYRLKPTDDSHLLIKASTVAGRMLQAGLLPELKKCLAVFATTDDSRVVSEARYQLAFTLLAEVFLAVDRPSLLDRLKEARAAFARVEATEEVRPDATTVRTLLDMFVAFADWLQVPLSSAEMAATSTLVRRLWSSPSVASWPGYVSEQADLLSIRAWEVADAISRISVEMMTAEQWRNFDAALIVLARFYGVLRRLVLGSSNASLQSAINKLADQVLVPRLGPVLANHVGRQRLVAIRDAYVGENGCDSIAEGLYVLISEAERSDIANARFSGDTMMQLAAVAEATGQSPEGLVQNFTQALASGTLDQWGRGLRMRNTPLLPIDRPELYGQDPTVDETVRDLLYHLRNRLKDYPREWWVRLVAVVESVVAFTHHTRDALPDYTRCVEDGGLGQQASEGNLKEDLFRWLRQKFGAAASYERDRIAGGRSDSGVFFPESEIPIEVKREFQYVTVSHVRVNYLGQPSDYASARQRVSILLILDLRTSNGAGHQDQVKAARRAGMGSQVSGLYSLCDSFWLDALPTDSQICSARPSLVLIGLVPGNRARPSSKTRYSQRPR
jgi:hypothetical protein